MKDGLIIREKRISSGYVDIATYTWRRIDSGELVETLYLDIRSYNISITPEHLVISNREA
jgi:hypothetical protein